MINALIIDDEKNSMDALIKLLKRAPYPVKVIATAGTVEDGLTIIRQHRGLFDILFLDIQLSGGNGFSLLTSLSTIDFKVIFTTAYDQYAIHAIRFAALDYLLKPIDQEELHAALERYQELPKQHLTQLNHFKDKLVQNKTFERLAIPTLSDITFIDLSDIIYLESDNNYTNIHMQSGQLFVSSKNIGYYEDILERHGFCRIHNSHIVNVNRVRRYIKGKNGLVELINGKKLEVSGKRKDMLFELLKIS